jgi:hypothetical protein
VRVRYRGVTHELSFSFTVSPEMSKEQKSAYIEGLYAERIKAAKQTWPAPWPEVTSALLVAIQQA